MKRDEVLSLLKDLMVACETMRLAPVVCLMQDATQDKWKLRVKWINENEKGCFDKIIQNRGLTVKETDDGYTVFVKA